MRCFCQCRKREEGDKYLKEMENRSLVPSVEIYEALIASHFEQGDKARALHLHNEIISKGLKPSCSYLYSATTEQG